MLTRNQSIAVIIYSSVSLAFGVVTIFFTGWDPYIKLGIASAVLTGLWEAASRIRKLQKHDI